jgi:hypothetical protein
MLIGENSLDDAKRGNDVTPEPSEGECDDSAP